MKKLAICSMTHPDASIFDPNARDEMTEPGLFWLETLREKGVEVVWAFEEGISGADCVLFWDGIVAHTPAGHDTLEMARKMGVRTVLILWEPPARWPDNYAPAFLRRFDRVLTYSDDLQGGNIAHFRWGQPTTTHVGPKSFSERRLLCAMTSNLTCQHPDELYTRRAREYDYFGSRGELDLYGKGWDGLPYYRGQAVRKADVFDEYRFVLVYENASAPRGYMTEKLFDALRYGVVPVYLGCENWREYVDSACVVDRRYFVTLDALRTALHNMTAKEWDARRNAARDYLASEQFAQFSPAAFAASMNEALGC